VSGPSSSCSDAECLGLDDHVDAASRDDRVGRGDARRQFRAEEVGRRSLEDVERAGRRRLIRVGVAPAELPKRRLRAHRACGRIDTRERPRPAG